jgi:mRNA-degrading endonuclease toxin of MazEF toxin-antitoxin module
VDRGDVFHVDLDPIQGREQAGARYVLIVSTKAFNVLGTPLVCPITQGGNFARHTGFADLLDRDRARSADGALNIPHRQCIVSSLQSGGHYKIDLIDTRKSRREAREENLHIDIVN